MQWVGPTDKCRDVSLSTVDAGAAVFFTNLTSAD
jgi:hypothetical protein